MASSAAVSWESSLGGEGCITAGVPQGTMIRAALPYSKKSFWGYLSTHFEKVKEWGQCYLYPLPFRHVFMYNTFMTPQLASHKRKTCSPIVRMQMLPLPIPSTVSPQVSRSKLVTRRFAFLPGITDICLFLQDETNTNEPIERRFLPTTQSY